jgi:ATP-dependent exoDNAse (exonuclease V) alpha subunit
MTKGKQAANSESADTMARDELRQETMCRIRKYLSTSIFDGIGPVIAGRVVARFGIETVPVIETVPDRLGDVRGLGEKRKLAIVQGWAMQMRIRKAVSSMTTLIPEAPEAVSQEKEKAASCKTKMRMRRISARKKIKRSPAIRSLK